MLNISICSQFPVVYTNTYQWTEKCIQWLQMFCELCKQKSQTFAAVFFPEMERKQSWQIHLSFLATSFDGELVQNSIRPPDWVITTTASSSIWFYKSTRWLVIISIQQKTLKLTVKCFTKYIHVSWHPPTHAPAINWNRSQFQQVAFLGYPSSAQSPSILGWWIWELN